MKVLLINTFLYHRGGDCTYTFALGDMLKSNGHEVYYWGMNHPKNYQYEYSNFFVDHIDYNEINSKKTIQNSIKVIKRCIYSFHAKEKLRHLIQKVKPDIAHLQGILEYLTPSIIDELKKNDIPIIWTLHDYRLLCPDWHFLRHGMICEQCKRGKYYYCVLHKCKKKSFGASLIAAIESYTYNLFSIDKKVDYFVAPSKFLYDKFIDYGWPKEKITQFYYHLYPFPDLNIDKRQKGDYGLYLGGLVPWKGVDTLIEACQWIDGYQIMILGDGELRYKLKKQVYNLALNNVKFKGHRRGEELISIVRGASFLVIPSRWYENCPYVIMEAQSYGVPVIGSNIGGIKNLVSNQEDGLLFEMDNPEDLAKKIRYLVENPNKAKAMGMRARLKAEREYDPNGHYRKIIDTYEKVCKG